MYDLINPSILNSSVPVLPGQGSVPSRLRNSSCKYELSSFQEKPASPYPIASGVRRCGGRGRPNACGCPYFRTSQARGLGTTPRQLANNARPPQIKSQLRKLLTRTEHHLLFLFSHHTEGKWRKKFPTRQLLAGPISSHAFWCPLAAWDLVILLR